jgi:hypothetical protein
MVGMDVTLPELLIAYHPKIVPAPCEYNGRHFVEFSALSAGDAYQQY